MKTHPLLSQVALSNLFTKGVAVKYDPRQAIRAMPGVPDEAIRRLSAQLILEETMETIHALGFLVMPMKGDPEEVPCQPNYELLSHDGIDNEWHTLEEIIDGACDLIYVATGALVACGVPDLPHLAEVCRANNSKFPDGKAIINPETGKYLKPEGWQAPDHNHVLNCQRRIGPTVYLNRIQEEVLKENGG